MNLFKLKTLPEVSLSTLVRPSTPNTYFVCPQDFSTSMPDQIAPVFPQSADSTLLIWKNLVARQLKTIELQIGAANDLRVTHVQRTSLLGYPDIITTEFIAASDGQSTLAIYSRSQYGHSDWGANRKRVTSWLSQLTELVG